MNVPQEQLDAWAKRMLHANALLLDAGADLSRGDTERAQERLEAARRLVWTQKRALVDAGADDPLTVSLNRQFHAVPLELLCSLANRRYARRLREAYEAALEVDRERGLDGDGPAEVIESWLAEVEQEVYGPVGLRERE